MRARAHTILVLWALTSRFRDTRPHNLLGLFSGAHACACTHYTRFVGAHFSISRHTAAQSTRPLLGCSCVRVHTLYSFCGRSLLDFATHGRTIYSASSRVLMRARAHTILVLWALTSRFRD